jgi:uncharacterized protein (DUF885 family)
MHEAGQRGRTAIDAIAEQYLDDFLELVPEERVYLGRPGREGEYADHSPAGAEARAALAASTLTTIEAAEPVDDVDRVTKLDLTRSLKLAIATHESGFDERNLNVIASPAQELREIFDLMPTATETDWAHIADRMHNLPAAMEGYIETLRSGIAQNAVPAIRQIEENIAQAAKLTAPDSFFRTFAAEGGSEHSALAKRLDEGAAVASEAYARFSEFLRTELAPHAPTKDAVGRELYEIASSSFLGAEIDLDETYEWGIDELARMTDEQEAIAREIVPGATVAEAIAFLDGEGSTKLHGTKALQEWMQATSDRAIDELGRTHFDIPDEIRQLECMIAPTNSGGIYYTPPADDFSRAGRMWWSVPEGVTEFDTWRELTTVYHEGVPGHHLQLAQAVYNKAQLNAWRRIAGTSGHAEGWALYAERLMDELGHLTTPAERLGMLDGQRMRAARVVLDIGVHLEKKMPGSDRIWTGNDAFPFLRANVNMDDAFVRFEVNRYLGWPGQAPSYKVGQRIWEQLRDESRRREGAAFDIKAFHKRALDIGGVGLDTLRTAILG